MKKLFTGICAAALPFFLTGCGGAGGSLTSASIIYLAAALLSFLLLAGYCLMLRQRNRWFMLLFSSVLVVNIGYFVLSVSGSLESALIANRIAYLGSVFLPLSMLMTILEATRLRFPRWLPGLLLGLGAVVFLVAASPGILDIYYQEVTLVIVDGVSTLRKVYGPLHFLYAVYLLCYFCVMVAVIIHAAAAKKLESAGHTVILAIAVLANLGVWFVEQLSDFNFEFLSISYIISELFLLGLHLMVAEQQRLKKLVTEKEQALIRAAAQTPARSAAPDVPYDEPAGADRLRLRQFADGVLELTQTEKLIFEAYIARTSTKEIMAALNIKENTLKFHNKNLYQKLGVSSRKELLELHRQLRPDPPLPPAPDIPR